MYFKSVGYLQIKEPYVDDLNRARYRKTIEKKVFCNIKSVGYNEFFQAQAVGFKPEIKVELRCKTIADATHFRIKEKVYKIIRIYQFQDKVELTLNAMVIENGDTKL